MKYCIYNVKTTQWLHIRRNGCWVDAIYNSFGAARSGLTRHLRKAAPTGDVYKIAELEHYKKYIERTVTKRNLLTGKEFTTSVNTPACCDPSTETYHAM